jgi:hypothetical protein
MDSRSILLCLFAAACAGCADARVSPKAVCTTQGLDWAIGKPADEATVFKLRTDSRTGLWRIVTPGQVIRRDQRADRLTIRVDAQNTITGLACE